MNKKLIALVFALILIAVSITGCGDKKETGDNQTQPTKASEQNVASESIKTPEKTIQTTPTTAIDDRIVEDNLSSRLTFANFVFERIKDRDLSGLPAGNIAFFVSFDVTNITKNEVEYSSAGDLRIIHENSKDIIGALKMKEYNGTKTSAQLKPGETMRLGKCIYVKSFHEMGEIQYHPLAAKNKDDFQVIKVGRCELK